MQRIEDETLQETLTSNKIIHFHTRKWGAMTIKEPRLESLPKITFYMACGYWSIKYQTAFKMQFLE